MKIVKSKISDRISFTPKQIPKLRTARRFNGEKITKLISKEKEPEILNTVDLRKFQIQAINQPDSEKLIIQPEKKPAPVTNQSLTNKPLVKNIQIKKPKISKIKISDKKPAIHKKLLPSNEKKVNVLEKIINVSQITEPPAITKQPLSIQTTDENAFTTFFKLKSNPFSDSLDTTFFYKSKQHKNALLELEMIIENNISFGLLFGKSGTGKTLISQLLLEKLNRTKFIPILVPVTPGLSKCGLLNILLTEFGYKESLKTKNSNEMINLLKDKILLSYQHHIKPIIFIDECHFLSSDALHILRTLSNFEAHNKKLITCLLFAEKLFLRRLQNPYYASLKSRIFSEAEITPFNFEECKDYINHRLKISNNNNENFFSEDDYKIIYAKSNGIPRNINKESSKILLNKFKKFDN